MPVKPYITAENAKQLQRKSCESKLRIKLAQSRGQDTQPAQSRPQFSARVTTTLETLIDMTTDGFVRASTPRDQQCLAMALDRLLGSWSLLTGHPRPGVRRVARESSRPPGPTMAPLEQGEPPADAAS